MQHFEDCRRRDRYVLCRRIVKERDGLFFRFYLSGDFFKQYPLAEKYLPDGANGMVVFGVKGGAKEAQKLVDTVDLFTIIANVGDAKSLIIHPASTTHSQLSEEDQIKAGLPPELIRLSIGLENKDDIIAALADALKKN